MMVESEKISPLRVLVTGGRDFNDQAMVERALADLPEDAVIVHGAARGADLLADGVWHHQYRATEPHQAQWCAERRPLAWRFAMPTDPDFSPEAIAEGRAATFIPHLATCEALVPFPDEMVPCGARATKMVAQPGGPGGRYCCDNHGNELRRV